jgi:CRP-like cAMP-binding protein
MSQISATDSDTLAKRIVAHHSFPGASSAAIERVLAKGTYKSVVHGEEICSEGDLGNEFFFLVRGNISVMRRDINGTNRMLSDMTCPCVFGHMAVIDGSRRSATCMANGPVDIVVVQRSQLDQMITEGTVAGVALRRLLIASLCDQLSNANGFVRRIVLDHSDTPDAVPQPHGPFDARRMSEPTNTSEDLQTVSAMLGGWASDLADIEKLNDDVEFIMDEDMKRTHRAKKNR